MKRWEPHHHPFDQIVLTVEGTQVLEVEGKAYECPPRSVSRIAGDLKHTGWPTGGKPVLNIDVFPTRPDYMHLVDWQEGFPPRDKNAKIPTYHQTPTQADFKGEWLEDTKGLVYEWEKMALEPRYEGKMQRTGFRGDNSLITFNWIDPAMKGQPPHQHPFDQIIIIVEGGLMLEVDGVEMEMGPRTITRIPPNVPHTGRPITRERTLNIDVFSPPRADYLYLANYQKEFAPA
jgi:quercetin dioxygenase-like cupin family protein